MSKKLAFAILALLVIFLIGYTFEDTTVATEAIKGVGLITMIYLTGQSGVDGVSKYKG